jgi:small subunit ribosomal protein S2e
VQTKEHHESDTDNTAQSKGSTATQGNFLKATVAALAKTYQFQSPDLWQIIPPGQTPYDEYASHLRIAAQKAAY